MGAILATDTAPSISRHLFACQAWRFHDRRGSSPADDPPTFLQSTACSAPASHRKYFVMDPVIEPIVGRYIRLELKDKMHRIYFEESGQGIPLVCLHTAGSDATQFRHLMNDPDVTSHFRVIAFDLPWHGKSNPPQGWQKEEYRLTTESYILTIRAFCSALRLVKPVVLGCSIGGRIVLALAIHHGAEFGALIGLESAA